MQKNILLGVLLFCSYELYSSDRMDDTPPVPQNKPNRGISPDSDSAYLLRMSESSSVRSEFSPSRALPSRGIVDVCDAETQTNPIATTDDTETETSKAKALKNIDWADMFWERIDFQRDLQRDIEREAFAFTISANISRNIETTCKITPQVRRAETALKNNPHATKVDYEIFRIVGLSGIDDPFLNLSKIYDILRNHHQTISDDTRQALTIKQKMLEQSAQQRLAEKQKELAIMQK